MVQRKAGGFKRGDAVASSLCRKDKQSLSSRLDKLRSIWVWQHMAANSKAVSMRIEPSRSGQRAHDLRIGPQPEYVDAERSHLNRVLIAPKTNDELRADWLRVKEAVGKKGKLRSNQNLSYAGIITFGTEAQTIFEALPIQAQDAAFRDLSDRISARLNTQLTGLVIHLDETALHAHFQLRGIANDGAMLSQTLKRVVLREAQDIAAEVMAEHAPGIERGKAVTTRRAEGDDYAATLHRSVKQLHADLPAEIAAKEAELSEVVSKLQTNLSRLVKAHADLQKAIEHSGAESEKAEKFRKRAETYEKRAGDAQAELDRLTAAKDAQQAALDRIELARTRATTELDGLTSAVAQKKTNIAALLLRKSDLHARLKSLSAA